MSQAKILDYEHETPPTNQGQAKEIMVQPVKRFPIWLGSIPQCAHRSSCDTLNKKMNSFLYLCGT
eukprot:15295433-Ditylum_brightwellii.AAC.1